MIFSKTLPVSMARSAAVSSLAPARRVLLTGEGAGELATHVTARHVCEGNTLRFICGDNRFDPYAISRFAKTNKLRPEDALSRILIARAFTAYQLVELVSRLDPATSNGLVVISGMCSTFFDEDVPGVDAARLFYRSLWRIVELSRSGMTLLITQGRMPVGTRRAYFLKDLCYAADTVLRFDGRHSFRLEQRGRAALPRLAALDQKTGD